MARDFTRARYSELQKPDGVIRRARTKNTDTAAEVYATKIKELIGDQVRADAAIPGRDTNKISKLLKVSENAYTGMQRIQVKALDKTMNSLAKTTIVGYNPESFPDEYDESVSIIADIIESTKPASIYHKFIQDIGLSYDDVAELVYGKLTKDVLRDSDPIIIDPTTLLDEIESVTDAIGTIARKTVKASKRPFFF